MRALRGLRSYGEPGTVVHPSGCVELVCLVRPVCAAVLFAFDHEIWRLVERWAGELRCDSAEFWQHVWIRALEDEP